MRRLLLPTLCSVFLSATAAKATTLDLTSSGAFGTLNSAVFIQGATLSGTGVFPAFVQVTGNDAIHDAYNTTANNVNDNGSSDTFNHEITLAVVPQRNYLGTDYYSFYLDINESNNVSDKYLSLDILKVFTSTTANQSSVPLPSGTLRYDMLAANNVLLNFDLEPGSGRADMELLIPKSNFAGALNSDFVYLYSSFGAVGLTPPVGAPAGNYGASDGFEEWALGLGTPGSPPPPPPPDPSAVPEPGSLILLGSGLAGLAAAARRRRQQK